VDVVGDWRGGDEEEKEGRGYEEEGDDSFWHSLQRVQEVISLPPTLHS
jgi:hypothetical protein